MITIVRDFHFDAGHRVLNHESKCAHLHGHRYKAEVEVRAPELDKLGRVIDFGDLKKVIGTWIDDNWDHNFLCHQDDVVAFLWKQLRDEKLPGKEETVKALFAGKAPYIFPSKMNPTAENIAKELFYVCRDVLGINAAKHPQGVEIVSVTIHETPNCRATYR